MIIWKRRVSFSVNWDCSKRLTIVNFTLCHDLRLEHCHPPISRRFPPHVLILVSQYNAILTGEKTLLFKFLWLEFRLKLFLELHVYFKGFMCIRMHKRHAECQVPADAHD